MTLTKCKRCEKHMTPMLGGEWVRRNNKPTTGGKRNTVTLVCEYCGWKVN